MLHDLRFTKQCFTICALLSDVPRLVPSRPLLGSTPPAPTAGHLKYRQMYGKYIKKESVHLTLLDVFVLLLVQLLVFP